MRVKLLSRSVAVPVVMKMSWPDWVFPDKVNVPTSTLMVSTTATLLAVKVISGKRVCLSSKSIVIEALKLTPGSTIMSLIVIVPLSDRSASGEHALKVSMTEPGPLSVTVADPLAHAGGATAAAIRAPGGACRPINWSMRCLMNRARTWVRGRAGADALMLSALAPSTKALMLEAPRPWSVAPAAASRALAGLSATSAVGTGGALPPCPSTGGGGGGMPSPPPPPPHEASAASATDRANDLAARRSLRGMWTSRDVGDAGKDRADLHRRGFPVLSVTETA